MAIILSLLTPLMTVLLFLLVWQWGSFLHRYEKRVYLVTVLFIIPLTTVSVLLQTGTLAPVNPWIYAIFFQGQLGLAFYLLVMFAGALLPKSKSQIALLKVRRELAILGFLWLIPHATLLIIRALSALNPTGTIAIFIIIPLVITSFPLIRRKMKPLAWRGFHYWAYVVYGLIYVHLASITLLVQWNDGTPYGNLAWFRLSLYTLIYGAYLYLKSTKTQKNALV